MNDHEEAGAGAGAGAPGDGDSIRIGRVGRPHGVRGGFYVDGAIDGRALTPGFEVTIADARYVVASRAGTDARPIISLEGRADRDLVAVLRGEVIRAARGSLTPLAGGEWYASDLEGMTVRPAAAAAAAGGGVADERRAAIGTVVRLLNLPSVDVLEVEPAAGGKPLLVPMVADAILAVDAAAREIVVDAAFLDLG